MLISFNISLLASSEIKKIKKINNLTLNIGGGFKNYPSLKNLNLVDHKVRILNPKDGTKALVRVRIESSNSRYNWSTIGVSDNVVDASYIALHDSITYHLLKSKSK